MKQIISKLLSESQNWMKCTRHKDAKRMCDIASHARALGIKGYDVDRSRFCPHPESDPAYICELGSWYFADRDQHQRAMSAINTLETFWGNEFNFKLEDFMKEVHENYERCGNNCAQMNLDRLAFDPEHTAAEGFSLPVCVSDHVNLDDFLKKGPRRWHFPSVCGDFTSNETEAFLLAANMGPSSQVAKTKSVQELWRDRIPRVSFFVIHICVTVLLIFCRSLRDSALSITTWLYASTTSTGQRLGNGRPNRTSCTT